MDTHSKRYMVLARAASPEYIRARSRLEDCAHRASLPNSCTELLCYIGRCTAIKMYWPFLYNLNLKDKCSVVGCIYRENAEQLLCVTVERKAFPFKRYLSA